MAWLLDKWEWKGEKAEICRCTLKACNPEAKKEEDAMAPGPMDSLVAQEGRLFCIFDGLSTYFKFDSISMLVPLGFPHLACSMFGL